MANAAWTETFRFVPCVGVGLWHTVVLSDSANLVGFGSNKQGQLGLGSGKLSSADPVFIKDPKGAGSSWRTAPVQVACGNSHTMILLSSGELYTCGSKAGGRLGTTSTDWDRENEEDWKAEGEESNQMVPIKVPAFGVEYMVKSIACGPDHTLCIDNHGDVWSWGVGHYGNLGHGSNKSEFVPKRVDALKGKVARVVAAGAKHSACVTRKGELFTWGHGDKGRLGNGAQRGTAVPELVQAIAQSTVVFVACGEAHSACISDSGELFTWGAGSYGRLGHGEESDVFQPMRVEALSRHPVLQVSLGVFHSVAVTKEGYLFTWGSAQYGKLGLPNMENALTPTLVPPPQLEGNTVLQAYAGTSHTIVVCRNGSLFTWGDGVQGKLGHGNSQRYTSPKRVDFTKSLPSPIHIAPPHASFISEAISEAENLDLVPSTSIIQKSLESSSNAIKMVSVGAKHSLALSFSGVLFAWGGNEFGQVGNGTREDCPNPFRVKLNNSIAHRIEHVAAGASHSVCCVSQGDVYAWGRGNEAQIGTGSTITEIQPVLIQGLQGQRISRVYASRSHSAALTEDGRLFTWGDSDMGKLGHGRSLVEADPQYDSVSLPRQVKGALASQIITKVSLGPDHSACIDNGGKVYTWGGGWQGKLGLGTTDNQYSPQLVLALQFRTCRDVSCGAYHTMFVTQDGDLFVCGRGDARLGLGDTDDKLEPVLNSALRAETENIVVKACAAEDHSMVITSKGRVWVWGKDVYGKLGLGSSKNRSDNFHAGKVRIESVPQMIDASTLNLGSLPEGTPAEEDIRSVVAMSNHCLALTQDSTVYGWGLNGSGRLGVSKQGPGYSFDSPQQLSAFTKRQGPVGVESSSGSAGALAAVAAGAAAASIAGASSALVSPLMNGGGLATSPSSALALQASSAVGGTSAVGAAGSAAATGAPGASFLAANAAISAVGSAAGAGGGLSTADLLTSESLQSVPEAELEAHIRNYLESGKVPPLYVVQLFLKAEPTSRQANGIKQDKEKLEKAEGDVYLKLLELVKAETQVQAMDYSIGLTIASTMRRLQIPGTHASGPKPNSKKGRMGTLLPKSLLAKIPSYEQLFCLLLANPRYMLALYNSYVSPNAGKATARGAGLEEDGVDNKKKKSTVQDKKAALARTIDWNELFIELVGGVYAFGDQHCEHLFMVLSKEILEKEIEDFFDNAANTNATSTTSATPAQSQQPQEESLYGDLNGDSSSFELIENELGQGMTGGDISRSLKRFLHPKMHCNLFVELATLFCSQPQVTEFLSKHFEGTITELFRGQNARTASGEEVKLSFNPKRILLDLHGNQAQAMLSGASRSDLQSDEIVRRPEVRQELEKRLRLLRDFTLDFFNQIAKVVPELPHSVRLLCKILHTELKKRFSSDPSALPVDFDKAIAKFLIDYLFRPAFLSPKQRKILPRHFGNISQQQRQNMVCVLELLQNIVADRLYTEEYLEPLNIIIRQHRGYVQAMVNGLLNIPNNLSDLLYFDVFTEYLRPREDLLNLKIRNRSLKFVRYTLHVDHGAALGTATDPLVMCAYGEGGILAQQTDRIAAEGFFEEYSQLKSEDNFVVNLEANLRFLHLERDSTNTRPGTADAENNNEIGSDVFAAGEEKIPKLSDFLYNDVVSSVPLPLDMLDEKLRNSSSKYVTDIETEDSESIEVQFQREIVDLPDFPPHADAKDLHNALEKRLKEAITDNDFEKAGKVHSLHHKLHDRILSEGSSSLDVVLKACLDNFEKRREAYSRLAVRLASMTTLSKQASSRLEQLGDQRIALENYINELRGDQTLLGQLASTTSASTGRMLESSSGSSFFDKFRSIKSKPSLSTAQFDSFGTKHGAYGKLTLRQLLDRKVVLSIASAGADPTVSGDSVESNIGSVDTSGSMKTSHDLLLKNKSQIHFIFTSSKTGFFSVTVVLRKEAIVDQFEVSMSKLAEMERVAKSSFRPSKLPLNVSVTGLKVFLEELTMRQLLNPAGQAT